MIKGKTLVYMITCKSFNNNYYRQMTLKMIILGM